MYNLHYIGETIQTLCFEVNCSTSCGLFVSGYIGVTIQLLAYASLRQCNWLLIILEPCSYRVTQPLPILVQP